MIGRPPRSTPLYSSAASDVYKRQLLNPPMVLQNTGKQACNCQSSKSMGLGMELVSILNCNTWRHMMRLKDSIGEGVQKSITSNPLAYRSLGSLNGGLSLVIESMGGIS